MSRENCAHCLRSLEESELTAVGNRLVCPRCQARLASPQEAPVARVAPPEGPPAAPRRAPEPGARGGVMISVSAGSEAPRGFWSGMIRGVGEWCTGRCWWWRLPLLLLMAYWGVRHLSAPYFPEYRTILTPVNLAIHEAGHLLFRPHVFGSFIQMASGSVFQCLVPLLLTIAFFKQRDYFAIALCFGLLSINIFEVAIYAADSQSRNLVLVSPVTDTPIHDWAFMLNHMGIHLRHARSVAHGLRALATLSMLVFLVPGSLMVWKMWLTRGQKAGKT